MFDETWTIGPMRNLTFDDLRLGLKDILETHATDLNLSITGKVYAPLLTAKRNEIEAQPEAVLRGLPFAAELAEADAAHDAMGSAIHHYTQALLFHPAIDDETKDIAIRAQQSFVPALNVLTARYVDEAAFAHRKRPVFNEVHAELSRIPVPGGSTLAEWIAAFLDKGDEIGRLLHERAEAGIEVEKPPHAGVLRNNVIGLLGRFRQAIRDEVASGALLPSDYEARLFVFIDQLSRSRAEAEKRRVGAKAGATKAAPGVAEPPAETEPPVCS